MILMCSGKGNHNLHWSHRFLSNFDAHQRPWSSASLPSPHHQPQGNELPAISASNWTRPCHRLQAESILPKKKAPCQQSYRPYLQPQGSQGPKVMKTSMAGSPKSGFILFSVLDSLADSNWPHSYPLPTLDKKSFCSYVTASAADLMLLFKDLETLAQVQSWSGDFQIQKQGRLVLLVDLGECQNFKATSQFGAPQTAAAAVQKED